MTASMPATGTGDREDARTPAAPVPTDPGADAAIPASPPRPAPVTVLAIIRIVTGLGYGAIALSMANDRTGTLAFIVASSRFGEGLMKDLPTVVLVGTFGFLAAVSLAAALLLLRTQRLGWTLTMLISGLTLVVFIWVWWTQGSTSSIVLLVEVVSVFYLNQRRVKETFGIIRRRNVGSLQAALHE